MNHCNQYEKDLPEEAKSLFELERYPLLDLDYALQTLGSQEQLKQLLLLMLDKNIVMDDVRDMQAAHDIGDWNKIQALAHKIKSGALYIGTIRMKMACQYLERYWKTGRREALEGLYQQMLIVIDDTHNEVKNWLSSQ